jgi:Carboxymuconolactone decarboxylase family
MARIQGVPREQAGPIVKLIYRFMRKGTKKMTGREAAHGSGIEPLEIWAHQPKMMSGMGKFQQAVRKGKSVDERLKYLVELKGAQMIGCEFCVDLGSQICRNSGFSDEELLALPRYRHSDLFSEREKLALDYTVAVMPPRGGHRRAVRGDGRALHRRATRRNHRAGDPRQPGPLQRRVRDRPRRLLGGHGLRAARSPDERAGAAPLARTRQAARCQSAALTG